MKLRLSIVAAAIAAGAALRADFGQWLQNIESSSRFESVFFRTVNLPAGQVQVRRPPKETRPELAKFPATDAQAIYLRAREAELQLDFAAAETDWKHYVDLTKDKSSAYVELADFYHRRLMAQEELSALTAAGTNTSFVRAIALVQAQAMPVDAGSGVFLAWIAKQPGETSVRKQMHAYLLANQRWSDAEAILNVYQKTFPGDKVFPVVAKATMGLKRGPAEKALAVYDAEFRPLWPPELIQSYFELLKETRSLRKFLEKARAQVAARPGDLDPAARLFYYYQQQGNAGAAQRALLEFKQRKETRKSIWTMEELTTLGELFEGLRNYDEAARCYYALYNLPGAAENALASLAGVLMAGPEQPIQFGTGDLSLYRDIATMDSYPGFLNGILSLLLNTSEPGGKFAQQEQKAVAYFHRVRAAELINLFDTRFPASPQRPRLNAKLIEAYGIHGDSDGVLARGAKFLAAFPNTPERVTVTLLMADAYARKNRIVEELASYENLLKEIGVRSPDHTRVLDRAIARLVSLKRLPESLALFRRELDRNPNEPVVYEGLAAFLEQNKLTAEIEDVYRRAIQHFPDASWRHKLARYYLKQKQSGKFEQAAREIISVFSGTEIARYFAEAGGQSAMDAVLYRQVNLYAIQRFPHHIAFVKNLLAAYSARGTSDVVQYESLLRRYWFFDADLRNRYFEYLSRNNKLDAEIQALKTDNPAATQLAAEAEAWKCHFESAAPLMKTLAADFPGDTQMLERAAAMHRSLGDFTTAISFELQISQAAPRDRGAITRAGEIHANRQDFNQARPLWNRLAEMDPGTPGGYLEAATVFWDYYQFDHALRLIAAGRTNLRNANLFAYETGAIYENKRDFARAITEYIKGAVQVDGFSPSRNRLIELARRPPFRPLIEQATSAADPDLAMLELRSAILEAQGRRAELEQYLTAIAARTSNFDLLVRIDRAAEKQGFDKVSEASLRRQIAVMTDPIERMRLTLTLVRLQEGRRDTQAAAVTMQALYQANPTSLGVVRAAVNFYWRTGNQARSIAILQQSAQKANQQLSRAFTLEGARKSIDAAQYAQARQLLIGLLNADKFNAEYIAALANSYAKQGDDQSLTALYKDKLQAIGQSALTPEDRVARVASMRRSLIPILTRTKDFAGALDQYIEIVNKFPEDESLVREAAQYAAANNRKAYLSDYYAKAAAASPKDARWPAVSAQVEIAFGNFPAAIEAFNRAVQVRPDRADLLSARANLEERLMRFDEAYASFAKLYDQTYRNPQWMQKMAEIRARQGRPDEAVRHVRQALIEGRAAKAELYFAAGGRLEEWNLLPQAKELMETGIGMMTKDSDRDYPARLYGRLMGRLRQYEAAFAKFPEISLLNETAAIAATYYTPEEKSQFGIWLEGRRGTIRNDQLSEIAARATLNDLSVKLRYQSLLENAAAPEGLSEMYKLVTQQRARLRFDELGTQLEAFTRVFPDNDQKPSILDQAADAYQSAANFGAELRVLTSRNRVSALNGERLQRFMELIAANDPQRIAALSANSPSIAESFANYGIRRENADLASRGIAARAATLTPAWNNAMRSLLGVYFSQPFAQVNASFTAALADTPIGQRLGKPASRDRQLIGAEWFYFGARYGELLDRNEQPNAGDYLASAEEGSPASAAPYIELGNFYRNRGNPAAASEEYLKALEIDVRRADAHNNIAIILFDAGKRNEALARWRLSFDGLSAQQNQRRVPESYWETTRATLEAIGARKTLVPLKEDADRLLRTYVRRNGTYRADDLMIGAMAAGGVDWVLDLSRAAANQATFLSFLAHADWIPAAQREALFRRMVEAAESKVAQTFGDERRAAQSELDQHRLRWIDHLLATKQFTQAAVVLAGFSDESRENNGQEISPYELRIAAQTGTLDALLAKYAQNADTRPQPERLRSIAGDLRHANMAAAARKILEFTYQIELEGNLPTAPALLGLAGIRLEENRVPEALALLRRATLAVGEPFENHRSAAQLLLDNKRPAEAIEFLSAHEKAMPWDFDSRQMLAEAQNNEAELAIIASSQLAAYPTRVRAASALNKPGLKLGSGELDLLVANRAEGSAAEAPLYFRARLAASTKTADAAVRFRLLSDAFAINNPGVEYRASYFRAALAVNRPRTALAILRNEVEQEGDDFLRGWDAPPAKHAKLASEFAATLKRTNDLMQSEIYYRVADRLSPTPAWRKEADDARAEIARLQANDLRRPVITENIEQDRIVQPMLARGGAR